MIVDASGPMAAPDLWPSSSVVSYAHICLAIVMCDTSSHAEREWKAALRLVGDRLVGVAPKSKVIDYLVERGFNRIDAQNAIQSAVALSIIVRRGGALACDLDATTVR